MPINFNKKSLSTNFSKLYGAFKKWLKNLPNQVRNRSGDSFKLVKRRNLKRDLKLSRYWELTKKVFKLLKQNYKLFLLLILVYVLAIGLTVGLTSEDTYQSLASLISDSGSFEGVWGGIAKSGVLFFSAVTGGLSQDTTEVQQLYVSLITIMTWLTSIWLLRNRLAGHRVKLRDGLYNASAPLISTTIVSLVIILQLVPILLVLLGYSAALSSSLIADGGVSAMLFWIASGMLTILSIYWLIGGLFALVMVTMPGMYPIRALKLSNQLVKFRRLRLIFRLLWIILVSLIIWAVILIPIILLDGWLKSVVPGLSWLPLVPFIIALLTGATVVWVSSYSYVLYREVVDSEPVSS